MNRTVDAAPVKQRRLTIRVAYGASDVERAAASLDVPLSDEEVGAILANIDDELAVLAVQATRSAVTARIFEDLQRVSRGHAASDDD